MLCDKKKKLRDNVTDKKAWPMEKLSWQNQRDRMSATGTEREKQKMLSNHFQCWLIAHNYRFHRISPSTYDFAHTNTSAHWREVTFSIFLTWLHFYSLAHSLSDFDEHMMVEYTTPFNQIHTHTGRDIYSMDNRKTDKNTHTHTYI